MHGMQHGWQAPFVVPLLKLAILLAKVMKIHVALTYVGVVVVTSCVSVTGSSVVVVVSSSKKSKALN